MSKSENSGCFFPAFVCEGHGHKPTAMHVVRLMSTRPPVVARHPNDSSLSTVLRQQLVTEPRELSISRRFRGFWISFNPTWTDAVLSFCTRNQDRCIDP